MATNLNPNIKILLPPIFAFLILAGLLFQTTIIANSRVKKLNADLVETRRKNSVLEEKLSILTQVKDKAIDDADTSLLAVPSGNPVLWVFQSLKNISLRNRLEIEDVSFSFSTTPEGSSNVLVKLKLQGGIDDMFTFISEVENSLPTHTIELLELESKNINSIFTIEIHYFNAPLPITIPALIEPIKSFTVEEVALLEEISKKDKPEFTSLEPLYNTDRSDPFR